MRFQGAEGAARSITPTDVSGKEMSGANCSRTVASSARPSRSLLARSLDTNQLAASEEITHQGCRLVQVDEIDGASEKV